MAELRDTYNLAYDIHFLLGIAILLPWNTFITAVDYISFLYRKEHVDKAFAVAYMGSSLVVLLVLTGTSNWSRRPSVRSRINAGLFLFICSLMVAPLLDLVADTSAKYHADIMLWYRPLCSLATMAWWREAWCARVHFKDNNKSLTTPESTRTWNKHPCVFQSTYNVADLVGKSLTAAYVPKSTKGATWGCVVRLIFYPLFFACLHGPKFFRTEVPVIFLTSALGLTNGYLTSALMILVPKSVPFVESETAGTVMITFLAIGLLTGSLVGWLWVI
ncbi:hypothetical protein J5N97_001842 [Dioscorea zingiberensis]|uniref:Uncharacterized protein n=1 Tax=Dioscorea zingiberensis TaxID=325984 RepID=A0A9D5BT64_9LILI|nr:hypothetical protein J5N97_001842 [Dioscorea zingiberensis]